MEHLVAGLLLLVIYSVCGFVSKAIFEKYCEVLFDDWRFAEAVAILMATVWPIGWFLMIIIGLGHLALIIVGNITWAFRVLAQHYWQAEKGEQ